MDSTIIEINHVCKAFRQNEQQQLLVLDDVNFDIHEGEIVALLGKSGSGKSTLLRILAGLSDATKGTVMYAGQQVTSPVRGLSHGVSTFCPHALAYSIRKCGAGLGCTWHAPQSTP